MSEGKYFKARFQLHSIIWETQRFTYIQKSLEITEFKHVQNMPQPFFSVNTSSIRSNTVYVYSTRRRKAIEKKRAKRQAASYSNWNWMKYNWNSLHVNIFNPVVELVRSVTVIFVFVFIVYVTNECFVHNDILPSNKSERPRKCLSDRCHSNFFFFRKKYLFFQRKFNIDWDCCMLSIQVRRPY